MIRARLNSKGDIAVPGAASILKRHVRLNSAETMQIRLAGFLGSAGVASTAIVGDLVTDLGVTHSEADGWIWSMIVNGAGELRFKTTDGREWSGRVSV